jgi:hypothetical protein
MIEGKLANQIPRCKFNTKCEKCNKILSFPKIDHIVGESNTYYVYNYLDTSNFIYETSSGSSVVYCSKYCRNKHNHRFKNANK